MTTDTTILLARLRALVDSLVEGHWSQFAVNTCLKSMAEIERLRAELAEAQARIAWLSGDQTYQPVPGERRPQGPRNRSDHEAKS